MFVEAADAADHAIERDVLRAGECEFAVQCNRIAQCHCRGRIQRGAAGRGQRANAQRGVAARQQCPALQLQAAGPSVVAVEREGLRTVLDQTAGTVDRAIEREILSIDAELTIHCDRVLQRRYSAGSEQRVIGGGERTAAERCVAAHYQRTVVQ